MGKKTPFNMHVSCMHVSHFSVWAEISYYHDKESQINELKFSCSLVEQTCGPSQLTPDVLEVKLLKNE